MRHVLNFYCISFRKEVPVLQDSPVIYSYTVQPISAKVSRVPIVTPSLSFPIHQYRYILPGMVSSGESGIAAMVGSNYQYILVGHRTHYLRQLAVKILQSLAVALYVVAVSDYSASVSTRLVNMKLPMPFFRKSIVASMPAGLLVV